MGIFNYSIEYGKLFCLVWRRYQTPWWKKLYQYWNIYDMLNNVSSVWSCQLNDTRHRYYRLASYSTIYQNWPALTPFTCHLEPPKSYFLTPSPALPFNLTLISFKTTAWQLETFSRHETTFALSFPSIWQQDPLPRIFLLPIYLTTWPSSYLPDNLTLFHLHDNLTLFYLPDNLTFLHLPDNLTLFLYTWQLDPLPISLTTWPSSHLHDNLTLFYLPDNLTRFNVNFWEQTIPSAILKYQ